MNQGLVVDLFAGGGGASTGLARAIGRSPDIAINHDAEAIRMHEANHPDTRHFNESVWKVDPLTATEGKPVWILWASPDCTHFSVAKGGTPVKKNIRGLANIVVKWARDTKPEFIFLENVREFMTWGPLEAVGVNPDGSIAYRPNPNKKGIYFRRWVNSIKRQGYSFDKKVIVAADMGAPTIRKRLFMVFRRDQKPVRWPKPTHGKGCEKPWRWAAECIDFNLPGKSIFGRKKELAVATKRRTARGVIKHVMVDPFLVNLTHGGRVESLDEPMKTVTGANRGEKALVHPVLINMAHGGKVETTRAPMSTIATERGGCRAVASAGVVGVGGRAGQSEPTGPREPTGTITGKNDKAAVSAHCITKAFTTEHDSQSLRQPAPTVTAKDHSILTAANLIRIGNGEREGQAPRIEDIKQPLTTNVAQGVKRALSMVKLRGTAKDGDRIDKPADAVSAQGQHLALSAVDLIKYYGTGNGAHVADPLPTITVKDRMALVTCRLDEDLAGAIRVGNFLLDYGGQVEGEIDITWIIVEGMPGLQPVVFIEAEGERYLMTDILLRMLQPRELARAQGFDDDYILTGNQSNQVARIGNSVVPQCAQAVVGAQLGTWPTLEDEEQPSLMLEAE